MKLTFRLPRLAERGARHVLLLLAASQKAHSRSTHARARGRFSHNEAYSLQFGRPVPSTSALIWQGMRTVISSNNQPAEELLRDGQLHNETWVTYPDDNPLRSLYGGDSRAALVPFLAHREVGNTYKWLLYGDDDTVWFMAGVLKLLEEFDPEMPYFITGK